MNQCATALPRGHQGSGCRVETPRFPVSLPTSTIPQRAMVFSTDSPAPAPPPGAQQRSPYLPSLIKGQCGEPCVKNREPFIKELNHLLKVSAYALFFFSFVGIVLRFQAWPPAQANPLPSPQHLSVSNTTLWPPAAPAVGSCSRKLFSLQVSCEKTGEMRFTR